MTQETGQHGLMDLNTFNWKKTFLTVQQIACCTIFLTYLCIEILLYSASILSLISFEAFEDNNLYSNFTSRFLKSFLFSIVLLIIRNIALFIALIISFFLSLHKLYSNFRYFFIFIFVSTLVIFLLWLSPIISNLFSINTFNLTTLKKTLAFQLASPLTFIISMTEIKKWYAIHTCIFYFSLVFLFFFQPCYYRYFVFYRTPIVRQRKLLWLNIVPLSILYMLGFLLYLLI